LPSWGPSLSLWPPASPSPSLRLLLGGPCLGASYGERSRLRGWPGLSASGAGSGDGRRTADATSIGAEQQATSWSTGGRRAGDKVSPGPRAVAGPSFLRRRPRALAWGQTGTTARRQTSSNGVRFLLVLHALSFAPHRRHGMSAVWLMASLVTRYVG